MKRDKIFVKRKYFALADLLPLAVVLAVLLLGCFRLFPPSKGEELVCIIRVDSDVIEEIPLASVSEEYEYKISGDSRVVLCISSEGVRFVESDCPDKLCVNTGLLSRAGQSAVCLPQRVSVTLVAKDNSSAADVPDAVVG